MKVDLQKRREVMERSMRLGHCICEPRRACPCDVFTDQGICPCAGERPDPLPLNELRLTSLVRNPGCASKISPKDLEAVLSRLPPVNDPAVISGLAAADDAAIYRLTDRLCLVQTVDVFTPCVDEPRRFGRICAANCLSDIYAMGGEPKTALSILAFPSETLPGEAMYEMLAGAMETLAEAGVALVGGHSIKDEEIKLGFAVTGVIDPAVAAALDAPSPGDVLVLTKPLGTGVLAFAHQIGRADPLGYAEACDSMATLNRAAAEVAQAAGATACTDITGFGLFGHLLRLLRAKRLTAELRPEALPAFTGVRSLLRAGVVSGALERNREFVGAALEADRGLAAEDLLLGFDPQTSGGLLIAVPPERLDGLRRELQDRGAGAFVVGRILGPAVGEVWIRAVAGRGLGSETRGTELMMNTNQPEHEPGCCADVFAAADSSLGETRRAFGGLMRAAQAPGKINERTKELILFALVVQSRCGPCFDAHLKRAGELGISQAELDEAAWCAVVMGGAPVKVFYEEALRRAGRGAAS